MYTAPRRGERQDVLRHVGGRVVLGVQLALQAQLVALHLVLGENGVALFEVGGGGGGNVCEDVYFVLFLGQFRHQQRKRHLGVAVVQVDPYESKLWKPGNHISGSRVESRRTFKLWVNWIELVQPYLGGGRVVGGEHELPGAAQGLARGLHDANGHFRAAQRAVRGGAHDAEGVAVHGEGVLGQVLLLDLEPVRAHRGVAAQNGLRYAQNGLRTERFTHSTV
jgi:hypothetical protein